MLSDKRFPFALTVSVLLNGVCVAVVGSAALAPHHKPHSVRSAASLHPMPLQIASQRLEGTGPGDATGQPGLENAEDGGASQHSGSSPPSNEGAGSAVSPFHKPHLYTLDYRLRRPEASALMIEQTLEQRYDAGKPLTQAQRKTLLQTQQLLIRSAVRALSLHPAARGQQTASGQGQAVAPGKDNGMKSRDATLRGNQSREQAARNKMSVVTRPSIPGRNSHAGAPGNSIAPKMVKYPRMRLDLGTIHMTRPKHGVTGGGSSDMRLVEIKVHYVVDDPNNVPQTLKPDRIIKMFASNCNGDPGNTARCLPTGGNTRLGGTTLHGRHDQISGAKYCVPGGGGIPGGSGSASQSQTAQGRQAGTNKSAGQGQARAYGRLAGSTRILSQPYSNGTPASAIPLIGWHDGKMNPNEVGATVINALHLPAGPSDAHGLVPGAQVPVQDRKWVPDPVAHQMTALPGPQTFPLPRFSVSPRSIGSVSQYGTISWGRPVKIHHKKQPYGGDGTGLLGSYYRGNAFNQLVMTRPDRNIDYDWSANPPDPHFGRSEEYSVRWAGKLVPKVTDTYTLMTGSDDGVRVYVNDQLLISDWTVHGPREDTAKVALVAGRAYRIKVEYYENGYGFATVKLYWTSPQVPREYIPEDCLRYPLTTATH